MDQDDLFEFNRILERKLYDLDRRDIHHYVEGSDDGFLYHRGFIVGMGREYYNAILNRPSLATLWLSSEAFSYQTRALYHRMYDENVIDFEVSRESCSNPEGWE